MSAESENDMRWLPLESNPDVMNKYIGNLGADKGWQFYDIFGLESELLAMVPRPVAAVMMLYPITDKSEGAPIGTPTLDPSLWFMKQTVGNACGTVGIVHALANNNGQIKLSQDGALNQFLKNSTSLNVDERANALGKDARIGDAHESSALEGQTEAPDISTKTNLHFVAFVHCNGKLYEMDGRKSEPMCHGDTNPDTLLEDSITVVKKFMARDPEELNFSLTALAKGEM